MTAKNILREGRRKGNKKIKRIGRRAVNATMKKYPKPANKSEEHYAICIDTLDTFLYY